MDIALCYESVLPARGGCETYIADLARRLVTAGHAVHLYASAWDPRRFPQEFVIMSSPLHGGRVSCGLGVSARLASALTRAPGTMFRSASTRPGGRTCFIRLRGFTSPRRSTISASIAGRSFGPGEGRESLRSCPLVLFTPGAPAIPAPPGRWSSSTAALCNAISNTTTASLKNQLRVVHNAVDPSRFAEEDRPRRRLQWRERWGIKPDETVALFVATNYHLKGLEALLYAVARLAGAQAISLLVAGIRGPGPMSAWRANSRLRTASVSSATLRTREIAISRPTFLSIRPSTILARWWSWRPWRAACR